MKTCLKIFIVLSLLSTISLAQDQLISIRNITLTYQNLTEIDLAAGDNLTIELSIGLNFSCTVYILNSTTSPSSINPYADRYTTTGFTNVKTFIAPKTDNYRIRLQTGSNSTTMRYNLTYRINGQFWGTRSGWVVGETSSNYKSVLTDLKPIMGGTLIYKYKLYNSNYWQLMYVYDSLYSLQMLYSNAVIKSNRSDLQNTTYTTTVYTNKIYYPVLSFSKTTLDSTYKNFTI